MKDKKRDDKKMNKKGAEMTIGTIVVIILALVVLVVVIYGFTQGWDNLLRRILGFMGGKANVQDIITSCNLACSTSLQNDYCEKSRQVVFKEGDKPKSYTCYSLQQREGASIGFDSCIAISCPTVAQKGGKTCKQWGGEWKKATDCKESENYGIIPPANKDGNVKYISQSDISTNNPAGDTITNVCCIKQNTCEKLGGEWVGVGVCDATSYDLTDDAFNQKIIPKDDITKYTGMKCCAN